MVKSIILKKSKITAIKICCLFICIDFENLILCIGIYKESRAQIAGTRVDTPRCTTYVTNIYINDKKHTQISGTYDI